MMPDAMLNFDYLKAIPELAPLHQLCDLCEQRQYTDPDSAAINARRALEWLVKAIYKMKGLEPGERASLLQLTTADVFADFIAAARKSIVAARHITRGQTITADDITTKRPGTGLSPMLWDTIVGTTAPRDYAPDDQL